MNLLGALALSLKNIQTFQEKQEAKLAVEKKLGQDQKVSVPDLKFTTVISLSPLRTDQKSNFGMYIQETNAPRELVPQMPLIDGKDPALFNREKGGYTSYQASWAQYGNNNKRDNILILFQQRAARWDQHGVFEKAKVNQKPLNLHSSHNPKNPNLRNIHIGKEDVVTLAIHYTDEDGKESFRPLTPDEFKQVMSKITPPPHNTKAYIDLDDDGEVDFSMTGPKGFTEKQVFNLTFDKPHAKPLEKKD